MKVNFASKKGLIRKPWQNTAERRITIQAMVSFCFHWNVLQNFRNILKMASLQQDKLFVTRGAL